MLQKLLSRKRKSVRRAKRLAVLGQLQPQRKGKKYENGQPLLAVFVFIWLKLGSVSREYLEQGSSRLFESLLIGTLFIPINQRFALTDVARAYSACEIR